MEGSARGTSHPSKTCWDDWLLSNRTWLRSVVFARLGRRDWTDEVLAEVALAVSKTWRHAMPESPRAWLRRVAVSQSLLFRRKLGREKRREGRLQRDPAFVPAGPISPLDWLLQDERQTRLRQGLAHLAPRDREILLLKFVDELSYAEIAERLNVTTAAAASRALRARQQLRQVLMRLGCTESEP